jgi:hypothetical protein
MPCATSQFSMGLSRGIRHVLLLSENPPWAFSNWAAQSGHRPSHHAWATWACRFRNTSLVYPFGISPTVAPRELQDHHFNPPCLHLRRPSSLFILQNDGRSWRCSYLLPQSAMVWRIGDVIFSCEIPGISYRSPMKSAMTFAFTVPSRVSFVV